MVDSPSTTARLEGFAGLASLIINSVVFWLSAGFWETREVPDEPHIRKYRVIKRMSLTCILTGVLLSISQCFLLNTYIVPYSLDTAQCQAVWRLAFVVWTVQRSAICLLSFLRLTFVFSDGRLEILALPDPRIFISVFTLLQCLLVMCFCSVLTINAVSTGHSTRCQPVIIEGISASRDAVLWILCPMVVVLDVLLPLTTTLHFGMKP